MSLHDLAANAISSINLMMPCTLYRSTGNSVAAGGKMTPTFAAPVSVSCQVQQLTAKDLQHMSDMNMQGITRKVWCAITLHGIDRTSQLGGDRLTLPDGTIWLVVAVPEVWPDWCTALLQKQTS